MPIQNPVLVTYCKPAIAQGARFSSSFTRRAIVRQIKQWREMVYA